MSHSSKLIEPKKKVVGTSDLQQEAEVTTWTCDWHLKVQAGTVLGSEPVTCGADAVQEDSAGTRSNVWDAQLVSENHCGAWEKTTQANTQE